MGKAHQSLAGRPGSAPRVGAPTRSRLRRLRREARVTGSTSFGKHFPFFWRAPRLRLTEHPDGFVLTIHARPWWEAMVFYLICVLGAWVVVDGPHPSEDGPVGSYLFAGLALVSAFFYVYGEQGEGVVLPKRLYVSREGWYLKTIFFDWIRLHSGWLEPEGKGWPFLEVKADPEGKAALSMHFAPTCLLGFEDIAIAKRAQELAEGYRRALSSDAIERAERWRETQQKRRLRMPILLWLFLVGFFGFIVLQFLEL